MNKKEISPLITSLKSEGETFLLVGTQSLNAAQSRIKSILESGASCILVNSLQESDLKHLSTRFYNQPVTFLDRPFKLTDLTVLGRTEVCGVVDRVFINLGTRYMPLIENIFEQCKRMRIPINTYQRPDFSTFSICSTYSDPQKSGLQIAVTTNGQGCLLANRIKRDIISNLPANISKVVRNMGLLREKIMYEDHSHLVCSYFLNNEMQELGLGVEEDTWSSHKINSLVHEFEMTDKQLKLKRSRWLSQMMEYYPLSSLADLSLEQLNDKYQQIKTSSGQNDPNNTANNSNMLNTDSSRKSEDNDGSKVDTSQKLLQKSKKNSDKGSISLVGSGPGSLSMLTIGALHEIKTADLVLADKLVPEKVLKLIPEGTETFIARKFPGNAERAQEELLEKGLEALNLGLKVVRLKQGDPYIFGRGGEEFIFFKANGFTPRVLPGLSSSLAATVVSNIPATQRDVADQVLICTGTGRKGALPNLPEYVETRTTVFLMALHRSEVLIKGLLEKGWDPRIPAAIVERASCPDQRITRTSLENVPKTIEEIGSRPPGLLVVGAAISVLTDPDLLTFSETKTYSVEEGYDQFQFEADVEGLLSLQC